MAELVDDIDSLGIKALRELITSRGGSFSDCIEKADLRKRAREVLAQRPAAAKPKDAFESKAATLGGYPCVVQASASCFAGEPPDLLIILLHGFGASNSDFTTIPSVVKPGSKKIAWVFPQAPSSQGPAQWWELDFMKWMMAHQTGGEALAGLIREEFRGLGACRTSMAELVREARAMFGELPLARVALGGFSQGAMTATDLALHLDERCAGILMLSGAPIVVEQWSEKLGRHRGVKIFISHGRADPVLPFSVSSWSKTLMENGGAVVTYEAHGGGHDLGPSSTIARLTSFIEGL